MKMSKSYWVLPTITQFIIWPPFWLLFKILFDIEIFGKKNLKKFEKNPQNLIIAINHNHDIDSLFFSHILSNFSKLKPIFWVGSTQEMYRNDQSDLFVRLFSRVAKYFGSFPAYRDKKSLNFDKKLKHNLQILRDKRVVCMFPEGKKSPTGKIQEGKIGISVLSQKTKSPVIPMRIRGTFGIKLFSIKRRRITIHIGEPMYPQNFFSDTNKKLSYDYHKKVTEEIMNKIKNL